MKFSIAHSNVQSMNSHQIAELVDARHDSVKRTVERLAEQDVITLPPLVETSFKDKLDKTQYKKVYVFTGEQGKLDSITVVAQLCPQFTADIVKRWQQLENLVSADSYQQLLQQNQALKAQILNLNQDFKLIKALHDGGLANIEILNATTFSRSTLDKRLRTMRQLGLIDHSQNSIKHQPQQLSLGV